MIACETSRIVYHPCSTIWGGWRSFLRDRHHLLLPTMLEETLAVSSSIITIIYLKHPLSSFKQDNHQHLDVNRSFSTKSTSQTCANDPTLQPPTFTYQIYKSSNDDGMERQDSQAILLKAFHLGYLTRKRTLDRGRNR